MTGKRSNTALDSAQGNRYTYQSVSVVLYVRRLGAHYYMEVKQMKIGENITLYAGGQPANGMTTDGTAEEQEKRKTLFAGNLNTENTLQDRIAQKKAEARKQAMKVVGEAWEGRQAVDDDLDSRRAHVKELKEEKNQLQQEAAGITQRQEELEKAYEAGEITQAEYLSEKLSLSQEENTYKQKIGDAESEILSENAVIRETRRELLKDQSMGKAWDQADAIMDAAGDEIIGMAVDASKEHIDEETEKREEQAEAIQEKKEEQEEILEKREERKEEWEELIESVPVQEMISMDKLQDEVKQEVQNIMDKMKLLAEDIKGAMVDETL